MNRADRPLIAKLPSIVNRNWWLAHPYRSYFRSYMFSSSSRMSLLHDEGSPDYNLQISRVKSTDAGQYLCQLNTQEHCIVKINSIISSSSTRGVWVLLKFKFICNWWSVQEVGAVQLFVKIGGKGLKSWKGWHFNYI